MNSTISPQTSVPTKILLVEDESEISRLIEIILTKKNYNVRIATNGEAAFSLLEKENFDLVLLDWMLPELSGLHFLQKIRAAGNHTPVIFITAKTQPEDIVLGLESGADDYLTKPFENAVLLARVESVLRRYKKSQPAQKFSQIKYKSILMNLDTMEVNLDQNDLHLTKSEFKILSELINNCEKVLTRDRLVEITQGEGVNVTSRTIDTHVFGLRKKLGAHNEWIETIRGVGYRLTAE